MVRFNWRIIILILYFVSIQFSYSAQQNNSCNENSQVKVQANIEVLDIRNINTYDHTFDVDFYIMLEWDPRTSEHLNLDVSTTGEWHPIPDFINAISIDNKTPENYSQVEKVSPIKTIFDGRYSGTFTSYMNFRKFPHDQQTLKVIIEDYDMSAKCMLFTFSSSTEKSKENRYKLNNNDELTKKNDYSPEVHDSLVDWELIKIYPYVTQDNHQYLEDGTYSQAILQIELKRLPQFYDFKIVSICVIITIISWLAMALSPSSLGERTAISVTSLLALVAHNYVSTDMLPKIPYLTSLDTILLGTQLLVFISALQNLMVFLIHEKSSNVSKVAICNRIDIVSFVIFTIMLLLFLYAYSIGYSIGE